MWAKVVCIYDGETLQNLLRIETTSVPLRSLAIHATSCLFLYALLSAKFVLVLYYEPMLRIIKPMLLTLAPPIKYCFMGGYKRPTGHR